jgi:hypothetical protein
MFVLSQQQVIKLLQHHKQKKQLPVESVNSSTTGMSQSWFLGGKLLDIGAGDGNVTEKVASLVEQVVTTEVSGPMVKKLQTKGFACVHTGDLGHEDVQQGRPYKLICLFNVLDRADKPWTMLRQIRALLDPKDGVLLLAVVLPFAAFVETGTRRVPPSEILPMSGGLCEENASFEEAATVLLEKVLLPAGFKLRSFSRLPYLCRGDLQQPYYVLSDAIFVLEVDEKATPSSTIK